MAVVIVPFEVQCLYKLHPLPVAAVATTFIDCIVFNYVCGGGMYICPQKPEPSDPRGTEVTGICEPSGITGTIAQILWKSSVSP